MEREVGGGIRMGNTCKPMAVSFQCMKKFTTNKKNKKILKKRMDLEESSFLTSEYTTKLQSSRQYGTSTKTEI